MQEMKHQSSLAFLNNYITFVMFHLSLRMWASHLPSYYLEGCGGGGCPSKQLALAGTCTFYYFY